MSEQVIFESTQCVICGHEPSNLCYSYSDEFGKYSIVSCAACGFQYLSPRPSEETIAPYYAADQYTPFVSSSDQQTLFSTLYSGVRRFSVSMKRRGIEKRIRRGRLLDIGCGTGEFLAEMRSAGWKVQGLEPSGDASEHARVKLGLDVTTGVPDSSGLKAITGPFDCISLWHVLEHIHRPVDALRRIHELLTRDGLLVIAVPNVASIDAGYYKSEWVALDPPRHLYHFTSESLERLLNSSGLTISESHQMPLDAAFDCLMTEQKLMQGKHGFIKIFHLIRAVCLTLITWLTGFDARRGSAVTYYIKKLPND